MSCSVKAAIAGAARVPVTVNGVAIAHDAISREAQNHPAPRPIDAWRAAARALAVRELLLQEARRRGLQPVPLSDGEGRIETSEEASIRALIEREISTPAADEPTCRRYFEQNLERFRSADLHEAAHILIAARPGDSPAYEASRAQARELAAVLRDNPQHFAELALAYSACPSKEVGGNLGQLSPGDTTPEFERALAAMMPGEVTAEPVASRFGHHVVRLERRIEGRQMPFEQVRELIAAYLVERTRRTAIAQFLARLAAQADISGIELPTPADLRVH
jgi:peptidyl-prolyl cis-trans isomerase C